MKDKVFLELVEKHQDEFFAFARRTVWDKAKAEDAFCAAVAASYENRHTYRQGTNFRAWMYKILLNKCFVANRESGRAAIDIETIDEHYLAQEDNSVIGISQDPEYLIQECGDEVLQALSKLRPVERSCFLLLSLGGYSYREIAEIIEIPLSTVVTHLARGRAKLCRWLCDYAAEQGVRHSVLPVKDPVPETKEERGLYEA